MLKTKIYLVEFIEYTNVFRDTVENLNTNTPELKFISVGKEGFLVREEHLEYVKQYGKGIRSAKLVGELFEMPQPKYIIED